MKKLTLWLIIISLVLLVGCSETGRKNNSDPEDSGAGNTMDIVDNTDSTSVNYDEAKDVKKYDDETHKQIQYGELTFDLGKYHIEKHTIYENSEVFYCRIDKDETLPETSLTIKIARTDKRVFPDFNNIISFLSNLSPHYREIRIYDDVTDDSAIVSLYSVTDSELTNYIVCYKDSCYLLESDYNSLELYLFRNRQIVDYSLEKYDVEYAGNPVANITKTVQYNENGFEKTNYKVVHNIDGTEYLAELKFDDEEYTNTLIITDEKSNSLLTLSAYATGYSQDMAVILSDINGDGYVDIQFLEEEGTLNNSYSLYVWENSRKTFDKVEYDGMLSYIEVHEGYITNRLKDDESSGVIERLVWKDNKTLVKESEEIYGVD